MTTVKRTGLGEFDIIKDGKIIGQIMNVSCVHGKVNGKDPKNHYSIVWASGKIVSVGPLASAKALAVRA